MFSKRWRSNVHGIDGGLQYQLKVSMKHNSLPETGKS